MKKQEAGGGCGDVPTWHLDIQPGHTGVEEEHHQQAEISQGETYQQLVEGGERVISDLSAE